MVRDTSITAYVREVAPTIGARQLAVLEVFEDGRDHTNHEISKLLGWSINRVTPRVNELCKLGILEDGGRRADGETGRAVIAWRLKSVPIVPTSAIRQVPSIFQAPSRSQAKKTYVIRAIGERIECTCPGYHFRGTCRHLGEFQKQREMAAWPTLFD